MRTELLKELERQQQKLRAWADVPGVDMTLVNALRDKLKIQSTQLMNAPRMGQQLREDRLIALVRQRLSIPGGCCSFDLPGLHIWLHLPQEARDAQVEAWMLTLEPLHHALAMILDLIRQSGAFHVQTSLNGFIRIMPKAPICCDCSCRWRMRSIHRCPDIKAATPFVLCRLIVSVVKFRPALIFNWPVVRGKNAARSDDRCLSAVRQRCDLG